MYIYIYIYTPIYMCIHENLLICQKDSVCVCLYIFIYIYIYLFSQFIPRIAEIGLLFCGALIFSEAQNNVNSFWFSRGSPANFLICVFLFRHARYVRWFPHQKPQWSISVFNQHQPTQHIQRRKGLGHHLVSLPARGLSSGIVWTCSVCITKFSRLTERYWPRWSWRFSWW